MAIGWDHPDTARYFEAFYARHPRYQQANRALLAAADLGPGLRVLDLGAGTGRTAELALEAGAELTCVEPAQAMRRAGRARVPRARWLARFPGDAARFDRVLCGAAIWQLLPLASSFRRAARLLRPGGALVFNIPSLYLGEPDPPGGGRDPYLLELPGRLSAGRIPAAPPGEPLPDAAGIDRLLADAGLIPVRWAARDRLTQAALRDWLKIPPLTDLLLDGLSADQRARLIEAACADCDPDSWRWETWSGWTAWKPPGG